MPTNLYGPGDNFDLKSSHVLPALLRKFVEAKDAGAPSVTIWGTGNPVPEYDPRVHFDQVKNKLWGVRTPDGKDAARYEEAGITAIDLTPASVGPYVVPGITSVVLTEIRVTPPDPAAGIPAKKDRTRAAQSELERHALHHRGEE